VAYFLSLAAAAGFYSYVESPAARLSHRVSGSAAKPTAKPGAVGIAVG